MYWWTRTRWKAVAHVSPHTNMHTHIYTHASLTYTKKAIFIYPKIVWKLIIILEKISLRAGWRTGSEHKALATQVWQPVFESPEPTWKKCKHVFPGARWSPWMPNWALGSTEKQVLNKKSVEQLMKTSISPQGLHTHVHMHLHTHVPAYVNRYTHTM